MELPPEINQLQFAMDTYLDRQGHSEEAYVKVTDVLNKWEFMVSLATQRALQQLFYEQLPENVIPLQRRLVSPDNAS